MKQTGTRGRYADGLNPMDSRASGRHSQIPNDPLLKSLYFINESKLIQNDDN